MAKRLTRARNKIRESGLALAMPQAELLQTRTADVLRVVYLIFSEGHQASSGDDLLRPDLCVAGVNLARGLAARRPRDPEVLGLLALLLLTDARRAARTDDNGDVVLLEEQDRTRWDRAMIEEGEGLLVEALRMGRPGPYQLWAAIAACHSTAASAADTDWRQISVLYGELLTYDPSPVTEANRAIAVAMAEGPAAGLTILDVLLGHPQLATWPRIHVARADLLARMGRDDEAARAYRTALELEPPAAERRYIERRLARWSLVSALTSLLVGLARRHDLIHLTWIQGIPASRRLPSGQPGRHGERHRVIVNIAESVKGCGHDVEVGVRGGDALGCPGPCRCVPVEQLAQGREVARPGPAVRPRPAGQLDQPGHVR